MSKSVNNNLDVHNIAKSHKNFNTNAREKSSHASQSGLYKSEELREEVATGIASSSLRFISTRAMICKISDTFLPMRIDIQDSVLAELRSIILCKESVTTESLIAEFSSTVDGPGNHITHECSCPSDSIFQWMAGLQTTITLENTSPLLLMSHKTYLLMRLGFSL